LGNSSVCFEGFFADFNLSLAVKADESLASACSSSLFALLKRISHHLALSTLSKAFLISARMKISFLVGDLDEFRML
jgi:hypothetical protein